MFYCNKVKLLPLGPCLSAILALLILLFYPTPALADPQDISAVSRSVVRVVLVAQDGGRVFYVGHGSGVAVAPNMIVTNAHVVEMVRDDPSIVIGVVPSQGKKTFGGKLVAYSPRNDLALIKLESGSITPATLFNGTLGDGSSVFALGYPGSVDRAEGLQISDFITPKSPVKTNGLTSGGRSSQQLDTILHTAPMAQGNSGGPLVDDCGRVLGINSFGSLSDGSDAEFGFAVSNRELAEFLRNSKVEPATTAFPCTSSDDFLDDEQQRQLVSIEARNEAMRAQKMAQMQARADAEQTADREIATSRENYTAIAALLLALAVLAAVGGGYLLSKDRRNHGLMAAGGSAVLLLGAVILFISRPSYNDAKDRVAELLANKAGGTAAKTKDFAGKNLCKIDTSRSRITVSDAPEVELDWTSTGCVNGRTQYGQSGAQWTRIFVPNGEDTASVITFDPATGEYRNTRYLLDFDTITNVREIRGRYEYDQCTADPAVLAELNDMQSALQQALPVRPNEVLVYDCAGVE